MIERMVAEENDTPTVRSRLPSLANQIKEQIGRGNLAQTCTLLEFYVREKPHRSAEWFLLGTLYDALNRFDAAIRALEHCVALEPGNGEAQFHLGRLRHHANQAIAAELPLRQAIATRPGWPKPVIVLGGVLTTLERWVDALEVLRQAVAMQPRAPRSHYRLGQVLLVLNHPKEAAHHLAEANRLQPDWVDPWLARAQQARNDQTFLDDQHDDASAWLLSALIEFDKLRLDAAIAAHWRAAALAPSRVEILFLLARCLAKLERFKESAAIYACAAAMMPDRPDAYFGLGNAALEMGDAHTSEAAFQKAIALDPNIAPARFGLAMALMDRGDEPEARRHFQAAARQDPTAYGGLGRLGAQGLFGAVSGLAALGQSQGVRHIARGAGTLAAYLLSEAALLGQFPLAIAADGKLLVSGVGYSGVAHGEYSTQQGRIALIVSRHHYLMMADQVDYVSGTHVFLGAYSNFGHWLFNNLGKLATISEVPDLSSLPLAIPSSISPKKLEFLNLIGFDAARLTIYDGDTLTRFEKLWFPESPWCQPRLHTDLGLSAEGPRYLAKLAERLDPVSEEDATDLLYMARGIVERRRVVNEDDVVDRLSRLGFACFDPASLSIMDQIRRLRRARVIVAPMGAGATIAVFTRPGTAFVECKVEGAAMDIMPFLCATNGLRHVAVRCVRAHVHARALFDDFVIPMAELDRAIDRATTPRAR